MKSLTYIKSLIVACLCMGLGSTNSMMAQDKPTIIYGQVHDYAIGGITVEVTNEGVQKYEDYILISISGLTVGEHITVPGDDITDAVKRYWKHGLFSDVRIEASEIRDDSIFLNIRLSIRPKVSEVNINGVKKNERDDLADKIGIVKGNQISPNMVDRAKIIIKRYFADKGFKNAEVEIVQKDDIAHNDQLIVDVNINKNEKVKINKIYITGNENIPRKKFTGNFFSGGLLKKTNEKGFKSFLKAKKFIAEKYEEDKERVIEKYNELGYRDAIIESDSVVDLGNNTVDIYLNIYEGQKYYLRDISWVGNTIYNSAAMSEALGMKRGDVYNQKKLTERLNSDDNSIGNQYYNHGYVFSRVMPKEEEIDGDSVDLVIYVTEGKQATINKIQIYGNEKVYEEVVRRELKLKPGDLFTMDAFKTTAQEIAQMGHFDPEALDPNKWIKADEQNGTLDLSIGLTPKPSDQVEFSLGWGQTGVIGRAGLKFSNFSFVNLNLNFFILLPRLFPRSFKVTICDFEESGISSIRN